MKRIPLTQGQFAIVDDADFDWLMQWKWHAQWSRHTKSFYAQRNTHLPNGKRTLLLMHRLILGLKHGDRREGDHINHDTLDHRRSNLRIVTHQENQWNRHNPKGYHWNQSAKKFNAKIKVNGKFKFLGYYDTASNAHAAYLMGKAEYHKIRGF